MRHGSRLSLMWHVAWVAIELDVACVAIELDVACGMDSTSLEITSPL